MPYIVAILILLVCFIYILYCASQDNCLYSIALLIFGPLLAWIYILFLWKSQWYKKLILFVIYYAATGVTLYWLYFVMPSWANPQLKNEEQNQMEPYNQPDNVQYDTHDDNNDPDFSTSDDSQ